MKNKAFDHSKYQHWIDPNEVTEYKNNAKIHTEKQIKNIANSIRRFGWQQDTVLTTDNVLVIGHGRRLAALKLGCEMPYHVIDKTADELTDEDIRELRIADNQTNAETGLDFDMLNIEIEDLDFNGFDFDFGIDTEEQDEEPTEIVEDEPPTETETRCKVGDLWQLGSHRLICGDSTDVAVIDRLMDGVKADMVFTDPPYGCGFESKGVKNDNQNQDDLLNFNRQWIPLSFEALKDNGSWYCWGIDTSVMDIYCFIIRPLEKEHKVSLRNLLTWDKGLGQNQNDGNMRSYAAADEKCLFVMCGWEQTVSFSVNQEDYNPEMDKVRLYMEGEAERLGITPSKIKEICGCGMYSHWFSKSQFSIPTKENYKKLQEYYAKQDGFKKEYDELKKDFYERRAYFNNTHDNMNNVWHFDRTSKQEREFTGGHATPKPIALCSRAIKSSSREGEIVLDVFGGSGSTLIACEQLNRKCYMCELDEHYCSVIIQRWENFTGKKAVLLDA